MYVSFGRYLKREIFITLTFLYPLFVCLCLCVCVCVCVLTSCQVAEQLMSIAYDSGVNLFDTAEVYAGGK